MDIYEHAKPSKRKDNGLVVVFRDYSDLKQKDKVIKYLSFHDQLTGLYNRRFFQEELARLDKERNFPITLVMADVNGLKLANDAFGYKAGDNLLKKIAGIISRECRADDIIARIGGDEFAIILPKTNPEQASRFTVRINEALAYEKPDKVVLSLAIGFAVKQDSSDNMEEIFRRAEDDMYRQRIADSSSVKARTIVLILNSLYEKNVWEMNHSKRVGVLCEEIASQLHFSKEDSNQMRTAGMLHDIGKIRIDEAILKKPEDLNDTEWREIMQHPEIGYRILSSVNGFAEIAVYILQHQEKWDGTGYPKALKGEDISVQARIIAVAAAYDAMVSERPYGEAFSEERAIQELKKYAGSQFDPYIARTFVEKVLRKQW
ncbi:MAG: diguanylate cyclase [Eubacteriales bacterium]